MKLFEIPARVQSYRFHRMSRHERDAFDSLDTITLGIWAETEEEAAHKAGLILRRMDYTQ